MHDSKKKTLSFTTKLRIIELFEAYFNSSLKLFMGRRLMRHTEIHKLNGNQLYARKGKTTYETLITIRVIYDMARLQRDYLISLFNDLIGNYDKIRPALATITTRRIKRPKSVAECHARTLRGMKHKVRTDFGISPEISKWDEISNPGGIG